MTPLWHAVVRYPSRQQHVALHYPEDLFAARRQRKQLVRSYVRLHDAAYGGALDARAAAAAASAASAAAAGPAAAQHAGGGSRSSSSSPDRSGRGIASATVSSISAIVGAASGAGTSSTGTAAAPRLPGGSSRPHKLLWVTSGRWVAALLVDRDVELYAIFDPLTEKVVGLRLIEALRRHYSERARQGELLAMGL